MPQNTDPAQPFTAELECKVRKSDYKEQPQFKASCLALYTFPRC
jgi:hypothetical protein